MVTASRSLPPILPNVEFKTKQVPAKNSVRILPGKKNPPVLESYEPTPVSESSLWDEVRHWHRGSWVVLVVEVDASESHAVVKESVRHCHRGRSVVSVVEVDAIESHAVVVKEGGCLLNGRGHHWLLALISLAPLFQEGGREHVNLMAQCHSVFLLKSVDLELLNAKLKYFENAYLFCETGRNSVFLLKCVDLGPLNTKFKYFENA